jgi:hypothetical protein
MKRPNNLTISLPQERLEQLERLSQDGESIGQCAKRLLLTLLDGDRPAPAGPIAPDELEKLRDRITALEVAIDHEHFGEIGEIRARLGEIEGRLVLIEITQVNDRSDIQFIENTTKGIVNYLNPAIGPDIMTPTEKQSPVIRAIGPGDQEKFVICEVDGGRPVRYWGGEDWTSNLSAANRYQSESSLRRTLEKLTKRKRENPEIPIRYNTIGAIERILGSEKV